MLRIEKTVFISYRTTDQAWAMAVFQNLTQHGYDAFIDYKSIGAGNFDTAILQNIKARAHFLVLSSPTALEPRSDPVDWMRREIEAAIESKRNVVPVMLDGFDFRTPAIASQLAGKLAILKQYNGLEIPKNFFEEAMERLRNLFLNVPVDALVHPASPYAQWAANEQKREVLSGLAGHPQVPWTGEQWARVNWVIQEETTRARLAATFLPVYGYGPFSQSIGADQASVAIKDGKTIKLATLQVPIVFEEPEIADPGMYSVLSSLRRAVNILGHLEEALVFNGQAGQNQGPVCGAPPGDWKVLGGEQSRGLLVDDADRVIYGGMPARAVMDAVGRLEARGYYGPFTVVVGNLLFLALQTPNLTSLMPPKDSIIALLGSGSLLRSSTLPAERGLVVALGGAPVELIVAKDVSLQFLQLTSNRQFRFRVYERIALHVKATEAIVVLDRERPGYTGADAPSHSSP
jgi:uncharacterized linocin/CFP29 family protein